MHTGDGAYKIYTNGRSQSQKIMYYRSKFIWNVHYRRSIEIADRFLVAWRWGGEGAGTLRMTVNGYRVTFRGGEEALKLDYCTILWIY